MRSPGTSLAAWGLRTNNPRSPSCTNSRSSDPRQYPTVASKSTGSARLASALLREWIARRVVSGAGGAAQPAVAHPKKIAIARIRFLIKKRPDLPALCRLDFLLASLRQKRIRPSESNPEGNSTAMSCQTISLILRSFPSALMATLARRAANGLSLNALHPRPCHPRASPLCSRRGVCIRWSAN